MNGDPIFDTEPVFERGSLWPPSCHAPTLACLDDGSLMAAWYSCSYETSPDSVIYAAVRSHTGTWSSPEAIVELPGAGVGNPVLSVDPAGRLWLFASVTYEESWTAARAVATLYDPGRGRWMAAKVLLDRPGLMTKNKPLYLDSGRWLLPVYDEVRWCSMVLLSEDEGRSWKLVGDTTARGITIQPALASLRDGRILMLSRSNRGRIYRSFSFDGGTSWTSSEPTDLPNPNSGIDLLTLPGGRLLLAYNDSDRDRRRLSVALSEDGGKTWPFQRTVREEEGELSYPSMACGEEETVYLVYTYHRIGIQYARLNEAWVRSPDRPARDG